MGLGLRESRHRDRRRRRSRLIRWLIGIGAIVALGAISYRSGSELANREVRRLEQDVAGLTRQIGELQQQNARLVGEAGAARMRQQELEKRLAEEVPTGEALELLQALNAKLAAGVSAQRLKFMIDAAAESPQCDGKPTTKRFLVRTPIYSGANDSVGFADSAITVTAQGESATSSAGAPEAWYDPAKPVRIAIVALGGKEVEAAGLLPLHKSVVYNGSEYRFTATAADQRGFVTVTADRCPLPQ